MDLGQHSYNAPIVAKIGGTVLMKPAQILAVVCALSLALVISAQSPERLNLDAIQKIKTEASRQSQLMEVARNITTVAGPRMTNSPNVRAAGEYARKKLVEWKLDDVRLETWYFGNGWTSDKFSMKLASDPNLAFLAYSKPWTPGTNGPITAEVVEAVVRTDADFARLRGKLKGKFALILPGPPGPPPPSTAATRTVKRFTDDELQKLAAGPSPAPAGQPTTAANAAAAPRPATPAASASPAPAQEAGFFAWVENALSAAPAQPTNVAPKPANTPAPA